MPRFKAPPDTGGITLVCGQFTVVDGHIETPKDIGPGDLAGLAANGFRPAGRAHKAKATTPPKE